MFPNFAKDNAGDDRLSHAIFIGKRILRYVASVVSVSDFLRLYLGETCQVVCAASPQRIWAGARHVAFAFGMIASASRFAILGVISLCPCAKMQRITAAGVIATMKHVRAISNRAIREFIRKPVSTHWPALVVQGAVSVAAKAAGKRPTSLWPSRSINAKPEINRSGFTCHMVAFLLSNTPIIIHENAVSTR